MAATDPAITDSPTLEKVDVELNSPRPEKDTHDKKQRRGFFSRHPKASDAEPDDELNEKAEPKQQDAETKPPKKELRPVHFTTLFRCVLATPFISVSPSTDFHVTPHI